MNNENGTEDIYRQALLEIVNITLHARSVFLNTEDMLKDYMKKLVLAKDIAQAALEDADDA